MDTSLLYAGKCIILTAKCIGTYPAQQPGMISTAFPLPKCQTNFCFNLWHRQPQQPLQPHPKVVAALFMLCSHLALTRGDQWRVSHRLLTKAHVAHVLHAGQLRAVPYSIPTLPVLPSALLCCNKNTVLTAKSLF